jgi:hypothetical protein
MAAAWPLYLPPEPGVGRNWVPARQLFIESNGFVRFIAREGRKLSTGRQIDFFQLRFSIEGRHTLRYIPSFLNFIPQKSGGAWNAAETGIGACGKE